SPCRAPTWARSTAAACARWRAASEEPRRRMARVPQPRGARSSTRHFESARPHMTLPRRRLGTTDLEITPVGVGAWAMGGGGWAWGWGPQDDAASLAAMRRAVELG